MRTRDVMRWHVSPRDALELVLFVSGCAALVVLDATCERLEAWVDAHTAGESMHVEELEELDEAWSRI